jgi:hypothetical protein
LKDNNSDYAAELRQYNTDIIFGSLDLAFGAYAVATAAVDLYASGLSSTPCVGLGACVTAPIPAFIIAAGTKLAVAVIQELTTIAALAATVTYKSEFVDKKFSEIGVTYESGAGDYAEYLTKANPAEDFNPGDIVGIKGGKISKNVNGAEKILVISKKPIVLGNTPSSENKNLFEKVAFLGQVPVRVFGKVAMGDYILPNGNNNGIGIAVTPSKIKSADLKNIVGIAWSESSNEIGVNTINVAVGLAVNDNKILVDEMKSEINNLQNQIAQTNAMLEKLVPGFKAPATSGIMSSPVFNSINISNNQTSYNQLEEIKALGGVLNSDGSIYWPMTKDQIESSFELAEKMSVENGTYSKNKETWAKINNDPKYKQMIVDKITKELDQVRSLGIEAYKKSKKR